VLYNCVVDSETFCLRSRPPRARHFQEESLTAVEADKPAWERALDWMGRQVLAVLRWGVGRARTKLAANKAYRAQMKKWKEDDRRALREFEHEARLAAQKVRILEKVTAPGAGDHPLVKLGRGLAGMGQKFSAYGVKVAAKEKARQDRMKEAKDEILRRHGLLPPRPEDSEEA
jgi:hypothetical protein